MKEKKVEMTVDSVEILMKEDEDEISSDENEHYSQEKDIIQTPTFPCPIGSCQFILNSCNDESREKHFQQSHTNVDFSQMTFLKL